MDDQEIPFPGQTHQMVLKEFFFNSRQVETSSVALAVEHEIEYSQLHLLLKGTCPMEPDTLTRAGAEAEPSSRPGLCTAVLPIFFLFLPFCSLSCVPHSPPTSTQHNATQTHYPSPYMHNSPAHTNTHTHTHRRVRRWGRRCQHRVGMAAHKARRTGFKGSLTCCSPHRPTPLRLPASWSFPCSLFKAEPALGSCEWQKRFCLFPGFISCYKLEILAFSRVDG